MDGNDSVVGGISDLLASVLVGNLVVERCSPDSLLCGRRFVGFGWQQ